VPKAAALTILSSLILLGCYPGSDAETFHRQREKERQRAIAAMRQATKTTAAGRRIEGSELELFLRDKTHVFAYESTPDGRRERYIESTYFRADGRFVYLNTLWARDPNGSENDKWRVDGNRLCVVNTHMSQDEHCYTLAVNPDQRVQYFIDRPGDPSHGLLTKITTETYDGAPRAF